MPSLSGLLSARDFERRCALAGATVAELCRESHVNRSVFAKWKQGTRDMHLESYRRLALALHRIEARAEVAEEAA